MFEDWLEEQGVNVGASGETVDGVSWWVGVGDPYHGQRWLYALVGLAVGVWLASRVRIVAT